MKNRVNQTTFILTFFIAFITSSVLNAQSVEYRQEFYKKMMAKGEAVIKSHNTLKANVRERIYYNENKIEWQDELSEFQLRFKLLILNLNKLSDPYENEFDRMNNFSSTPTMDYLKEMDSIAEKRNYYITLSIKLYEIISAEINSKSFKRWDYKVIDAFLIDNNLISDFDFYMRISPICKDIYRLNMVRNSMAYLKCAYVDWVFMAQNGIGELTASGDPKLNYNLICYKQLDDSISKQMAWQVNNIKFDINNTKFDYSSLIFKDYPDNSVFSSWMIDTNPKDLLKNNDHLYSNVLANASNTLSLLFLNKSLDFKDSKLSKLLIKYNLEIKNCGWDSYNKKYVYYTFPEDSAFNLFYENKNFQIADIDKESIQLIYSLIPKASPYFYKDMNVVEFRNQVAKFDSAWFSVYQIKRNLVLSSAYFLSISNDLQFVDLNTDLFTNWINNKMEKNNLKAYLQNDYMLTYGKTNSDVWSKDRIYIDGIVKKLRFIKFNLKNDFDSFISKINNITVDEFDKLLDINLQNNDTIFRDNYIIHDHHKEIYYFKNINTISLSAQDYNSIGWRCLLNNQYNYAEKYFKLALQKSKDDPIIIINLAHTYLFKGDIKKAQILYTKFPLDQIVTTVKLDIRTIITNDYQQFIYYGKEESQFVDMKRVLNIK